MRRPVRKDLQVNDHRPRLLTANTPDTGNAEPQICPNDRRSSARSDSPWASDSFLPKRRLAPWGILPPNGAGMTGQSRTATSSSHLTVLATFIKNRHLILELVRRDIRSRYVGSIVGSAWSILNPLLQLAVYTIVFGQIMGQRFEANGTTGGFALFLFAALLPWITMQEAVTRSAVCFLQSSNLIRRVRLPLQILPLSLVISAVVHQLLGSLILVAVLLATGRLSVDNLWLLALLFPFQMALMFGLGLTAACCNVFFRDVAQLINFAFMLGFWLTPIVYLKTQAPALYRWILDLNPLTHMMDAYRYAFLNGSIPSSAGLVYWMACCLAALWAGGLLLAATRRQILDMV